jgi:hypothetical protein
MPVRRGLRVARALLRTPSRAAAVALSLYLIVSLLLFGLPIFADPTHTYVGVGPGGDCEAYMWFLAWWPHAIVHGLNPFVTPDLWAPVGTNLTWANSTPGGAILAAPVTLAFGPVAGYNLLVLTAPALAAWAAFLLCREVTGTFWPSLLGGYVFGFSSYELGHLLGHLSHVLIFPIPLAAYLVVRAVRGTIGPIAFVLALAATLTLQFLFAMELFLSLTMFGAAAIVAAAVLYPRPVRLRLVRVGKLAALAYGLTAVVLSPYLYYLITQPRSQFQAAGPYAVDLANFVVPTQLQAVGPDRTDAIATHFLAGTVESTAYIGLPLLAILVAFGWTSRRLPAARLVWVMLAGIALLSLGRSLAVAGSVAFSLPTKVVFDVSFVRNVLPGRFTVHLFLVAGLVLAFWLADPRGRRKTRWAVAVVAVALLLPNVVRPFWKNGAFWSATEATPAFFADGLYERSLEPNEIVLVFPYGYSGATMLAQARTDMYFRMPEGYASSEIPPEFRRWPVLSTFYSGERIDDYEAQFRAFACAHAVTAVIVSPAGLSPWEQLMAEGTNAQPTEVGGVSLYRPRWSCSGSR